ncbi:hypothetical protein VCUG_02071 [Vavraia culicis subsp. floridensis]|uniref:Uncharacterized protein n=1 Tax=Vavraia culicis (isolate floridensis) TaxID=948595 RepID=L2GTM2_VAVCU|nr:uncharacterized protein VCUG_02071 [Vavraia culicis subsp. floridensis]ELA46435.1 hypothetical protein VCUG_02071 [Vavraia culicis subsp. floridensis]
MPKQKQRVRDQNTEQAVAGANTPEQLRLQDIKVKFSDTNLQTNEKYFLETEFMKIDEPKTPYNRKRMDMCNDCSMSDKE